MGVKMIKYKVKEVDKNYMKLIDGIPEDVTYRHLRNVFFILSIPIIGNIISFIMALDTWRDKGYGI